MGKSAKGGDFERQTAKELSLWWSGGIGVVPPRDDIFWRSSISGGRATQRAKSGLGTFGAHGDLAFTDPIGAPLLEFFTIELKRGYKEKGGNPSDLVDCKPSDTQQLFEGFIFQAMDAAKAANSLTWLLIHRRDHHIAMVYFPTWVLDWVPDEFLPLKFGNIVRYLITLNGGKTRPPLRVGFVAVPLADFCDVLTPQIILATKKNYERY